MSRRRAATGLATGLALIVAAPVIWWATQPEPAGQTVSSVNASAAAELAWPPPVTSGESGAASPSSQEMPSMTTPPSNSEPPASVAVDPSVAPAASSEIVPAPAPPTSVPATAPEPTAPIRIELPALGVDAEVAPVGVDSEGLMEIPQDVDTVGWYRFGPVPGAAAGSAVLSGHVDDYQQGQGVFARIGDLGPADEIRVTDQNGSTRRFTVLSREEWSKGEVPLDRLFDRGGSPRLVLITCGGSFNSSTLGYDDNIAITAVPIM